VLFLKNFLLSRTLLAHLSLIKNEIKQSQRAEYYPSMNDERRTNKVRVHSPTIAICHPFFIYQTLLGSLIIFHPTDRRMDEKLMKISRSGNSREVPNQRDPQVNLGLFTGGVQDFRTKILVVIR
jgi:hypothetical protein